VENQEGVAVNLVVAVWTLFVAIFLGWIAKILLMEGSVVDGLFFAALMVYQGWISALAAHRCVHE
jgi:hypothetical protein